MAQKLFNRERFREIRSMDRTQMEAFVYEIYDRGYKAGQSESSVKVLDLEEVGKELMKIKGIGVKTAEAVKEVIKKMVEGFDR